MKFTLTFKDPDGVGNGLDEAAIETLREIEGLSESETDMLQEGRREMLSDAVQRWIEFSEYITIEFDTEAGTATVKENS